MRITAVFLVIVSLFCCVNNTKEAKIEGKTEHKEVCTKEDKINCALSFINSYVENCKRMNDAIEVVEWTNSQELATVRFKSELKGIMEEAKRREPFVGLGFDPILDGQYHPEQGFEYESIDEETGYLIVRGKDIPQFKVKMKIISQNSKCLVDGCGIIGIPDKERTSKQKPG